MKDFRSSLKGIAAIYKPFRWRVCISVLIGIVRVSASMAFVWICKYLVDLVTGAKEGSLGTFVWIMIGIMLIRILCNISASYWESLNLIKAKNALRFQTFEHLLGSKWNGKEEYHSADVLNRIQEDIRVLIDLVCSRIPDIIIALCQLVAASIFLIVIAPGLLWLLLALMVMGVLGSKMFYKKQRRITETIRESDSASQQHIQENLLNRVLVLSLIGSNKVLYKFGLIQDKIEASSVERLNYEAIARGFMSFAFMSGYTAAFLWGVFGIRDGLVTYGMMTAFLQLVSQVQMPIANLGRHVPAFIQALTSEERLAELNALPELDKVDGRIFNSAPDIIFDNVTFAYPGQEAPVLNNFSHRFPAGSLTAIQGPTGEGKSTLARLAMGLLNPQEGVISFEENGVASTGLAMGNLMYVPQGNSLLSGTIRSNLLLANPDAGEEELKEALHIAAADFVFTLPDGLDTVCGETGSGLSEGQAQRIAVARALLHSGTVLILDESTSALDSATESTLLERLVTKYHGSKTILFISHRECVLSFADETLCINA